MKVSNVSFGAKVTEDTMNFLVRAKMKGLNTEPIENLVKNSYYDEFVITNINNKGEVDSIAISPNPRLNPALLDARNYNGNNKLILPHREGKKYSINDETLAYMASRLVKYANAEKISPEKAYRRELIEKLGAPVRGW